VANVLGVASDDQAFRYNERKALWRCIKMATASEMVLYPGCVAESRSYPSSMLQSFDRCGHHISRGCLGMADVIRLA